MGGLGRDAVVRLWDAYGAALVLYARQFCGQPEDVVQEAFLLLVRSGESPDNPIGWLYRVVRHRAINAARTRDRQVSRETAAARSESWFNTAIDDQIDAAEATAGLKQLPLEQREVIVARLWGGLSFEEIATLCGMSLSTTYRCYQRGLAALRERLGVPCPMKTKTMSTATKKPQNAIKM
jgi:RNA polymerase sigma factor (sigma-70 family)